MLLEGWFVVAPYCVVAIVLIRALLPELRELAEKFLLWNSDFKFFHDSHFCAPDVYKNQVAESNRSDNKTLTIQLKSNQ